MVVSTLMIHNDSAPQIPLASDNAKPISITGLLGYYSNILDKYAELYAV